MSLAKRIRQHIATHGPCGPAAIAEGLGLSSSLKVSHSLGVMFRSGLVTREGSGNSYTYSLGREATEVTPAKPGRTWAQFQADLKERKRLRLEAERIAVMARRIARENATRRAQATVKAETRKADNDAQRRAEKALRVDALASLPVARVERQSVDEWLAAGNQVERLPSQIGMAYAGLGKGYALPLY